MPDRSSQSEVEQAVRQLVAAHPKDIEPATNYQYMSMLQDHVQALATHCSKITDSKLLQQSGQAILQTLRACHESAGNLDDRSMLPKLYVAGFRALNSILAALRAQHGMSTAELVDLLRHFFNYGIELDASTSGAQTELAATAMATAFGSRGVQDIGLAGKGAYRPPHARRRSSSSTGWNEDVSAGSQSGSESDTGSDSDSSRGSRASSQGRVSAVRLAALTCLQQLAKADCRALHPFWIVVLPVYNPLQTKYHAATLMDAIVRDPLLLEMCRVEKEGNADSATPMATIPEGEVAAEEEVEEDPDVTMYCPRAQQHVLAAHRWRPASQTARDAAKEYIPCARINCQGLNCPFSHMKLVPPCQHWIVNNKCCRMKADHCKWRHDLPSHYVSALRPWAKLQCIARSAKQGIYPSEQGTDPCAKTGPSVSDSCGPRY